MTVSYRETMTDAWQYVSYIATKTIWGRCLYAFILFAPSAGFAGVYYVEVAFRHHTPLHHIAPHPKIDSHHMIIVFLLALGGFYIYVSFCGLLGLYLGTLLMPTKTITIDPEFCRLKIFMGGKTRWKAFSSLVEEANYFYFIGWTRTVHIPKRAFDSRADGESFFKTASAYWRQAKGIPPDPVPDVSSVWPPAPLSGGSQEAGSKQ